MKEIKDLLFYNARSVNSWINKDISEEVIKELYDLVIMGPTSFNSLPMRLIFVRSSEAKERLKSCMIEKNIEKTITSPYVAIIGMDNNFPDEFVNTFPGRDIKSFFAGNQSLIETTAMRNSSLQGAYLILAARLLGLDVAPMSGFDNAKVDEEFFKGTSIKSNFICALGYADHSKTYPRLPRPDFDKYAKIV
ncbi:MAG: malonic semialdehyde reductase [Alphaproteobacteria bacterium 33-17]|nr:MAG: malonic semialdehyde reductase [Alphaproteobacteria bacterium 33-17]